MSLVKAAYTIVTLDYLAQAKTLGDSLLEYNPSYVFFICLIGKKADIQDVDFFARFTILEVSDLDDSRILAMQDTYTLFELSCALKPFFAIHLLTRNPTCTRLKYFDSDILIFNQFDKAIESNEQASVFLTPHYFKPIHPDEAMFNDNSLIKYGTYNAGFFELNCSQESISFLKWWGEHLYKSCYFFKEPFNQIFVDQNILNLATVFFKSILVIKHLGYNTSFYNLHERKIGRSGKTFNINNEEKLIFFHYTWYKYYQHDEGSIGYKRFTYENTPYLRELCDTYRDLLYENRIETFSPPQLGLNTLPQRSFAKRAFSMFKSLWKKNLLKIS